MNKSLKAQIAAAFVADIAFGSNRTKGIRRGPVEPISAGKRITGTLSLRH